MTQNLLRNTLLATAVATALLGPAAPALAQTSPTQSLDEIRNTVINLLEALVQKGVMTREQAEAMVASAQQKASQSVQEEAKKAAAESDAVRVTYVPEIVRKQIGEEVRADIKDEVTQDVVAQAKADGWGVPGALPDWIKGVRLYGDVRARSQGELYSSDNAANVYYNFNAVNAAGGVSAAGVDAFLNTTEDRNRLVGRVRAGFVADLGDSFKVDFRLASGSIRSPVSTNQTLGNYGERWTVSVDKAAVIWNPINADRNREFDLRAGRFANPFIGINELIWDSDLSFEGIATTYAMDLFGNDDARMERSLFLTLGAFPLQEVELSTDDKWLYGGQLGSEIPLGSSSKLRLTAGYFMYDNITGVRNAVDDEFQDFTAPVFMQKGNTVFDIRVSTEPGNLYALAGDYRLANANLWLDLGFGDLHVMTGGEYVKNVGWKREEVFRRTGFSFDERTDGYEAGVVVGRPVLSAFGHWRAFGFYRYLQRDAVLDAFTDSDFHLGGTDTKGYQLGLEFGLSRGSWLKLRYITANEIDGPPLGIDVWQLDLNGNF